MSDAHEHYVYLIARRDGDRLIAPVKVGITNNLARLIHRALSAVVFGLMASGIARLF